MKGGKFPRTVGEKAHRISICRCFRDKSTASYLLVRMLARDRAEFIAEFNCWSKTPEAARSCSLIWQNCPQALFLDVGFLHQVIPADVRRVDSADSHTPYSDDLSSVGQDETHRVNNLQELSDLMVSRNEYWAPHNEVTAKVNMNTVVGLVYSTDHSKRNFDETRGLSAARFLLGLKRCTPQVSSLCIFEWNARDGILTLAQSSNV